MGVDPKNGWAARYEVLPGKEKVVDELKKLAKSADAIYLATDLDREGEAIAWHLKEIIGGDESAISEWSSTRLPSERFRSRLPPNAADTNRVQAQQARRFLDRVVGLRSRRCCGPRLHVVSRQGGFNPWLCASSSSASEKYVPLFPKSTGTCMLTCRWTGRTLFVLKSQNMKEVRSILRPSSRPQRRSGGFLALSIRFRISRRGRQVPSHRLRS